MILKENLLFNAVVKSQFNYCPLVWMFCSRTVKNVINKVHEGTLREILGDDLNDFGSLLQNNKDIYNHHIEMLKLKTELAPPNMDSMFKKRNKSYNFRDFQEFLTERKRTVHCGLETLSHRSPQLWSLLQEDIKEVESLYNQVQNILRLFQIFLSQEVKRRVIISNKLVYTSCRTT